MVAATELSARAWALPLEQRAELVRRLLLASEESVEEPCSEEEWRAAWRDELHRRSEELRTGSVTADDWARVRARLRCEIARGDRRAAEVRLRDFGSS